MNASQKSIFFIALLVLFNSGWQSQNARAERPHAVGVVDCRAFTCSGDPEVTHQRYAVPLFEFITTQSLSANWVPPEIFLPAMQTDRDNFQRIVTPWTGNLFSMDMYNGMTDYVQKGGLLIANSHMHYIDVNGNFKLDEADKYFNVKTKRHPRSIGQIFDTLGIFGHRTRVWISVRSEIKCPLTADLPVGEAVALNKNLVFGRETRNHSAMIILNAVRRNKDDTTTSQPAVTIRNDGRGTCIYIASRFTAKDQTIVTIFKNAFSPETLDWLTAD